MKDALGSMGIDSVDGQIFIVGAPEATLLSFDIVDRLLHTYSRFNAAMGLFGFILDCVSSPEDSITQAGKIKDSLNFAFAKLEEQCMEAKTATDFKELDEMGVEPLVAPRRLTWWYNEAYGMMPAVKDFVVLSIVDAQSDLVQRLKNHTGAWEHIVTDDSYAKQLATRGIINYKWTGECEAEAGELYSNIFSLSQLATKWGSSLSALLGSATGPE